MITDMEFLLVHRSTGPFVHQEYCLLQTRAINFDPIYFREPFKRKASQLFILLRLDDSWAC
jgi:hypothetical protein